MIRPCRNRKAALKYGVNSFSNKIPAMPKKSLVQQHSRSFREMQYVYPVVSRRSGGLSLGVNLSPTARCNFACVYCQVLGELDVRLQPLEHILAEGDRKKDAQRFSPLVDLELLEGEVRQLVEMIVDGSLFEDSWFSQVPPEKRLLRDIAFSGDGEPTLSLQFPAVVERVARIRRELCPEATKIVLITNGTTLHAEPVRRALRMMLENNGEIWAKLDAGTQEYYEQIARSTVPLEKVLDNLAGAARMFPLVIQTCFLALHGESPPQAETNAYIARIRDILDAGGAILRLQLYTVARDTPEPWVTPLSNEELDALAEKVRRGTGLPVDSFYSS